MARYICKMVIKVLRLSVIMLVVSVISACATPLRDDYVKYRPNDQAFEADTTFRVKIDLDSPVDVRGAYNSSTDTGAGGMFYVGGGGAVGIAAQLVTHAAVSNGMQDKKLAAQQVAANKILKPLQPVLSKFTYRNIAKNDERFQFSDDKAEKAGFELISSPIFFLSLDSSVLSLKHIVKIRSLDRKDNQHVYTNMVEVISSKLPKHDAVDILLSDGPKGLKSVSEEMYKKSLQLAVKDLLGAYPENKTAQKSFRIKDGAALRVERGQLLSELCNEVTLRNLRGWLISYSSEAEKSKNCSPGKKG